LAFAARSSKPDSRSYKLDGEPWRRRGYVTRVDTGSSDGLGLLAAKLLIEQGH